MFLCEIIYSEIVSGVWGYKIPELAVCHPSKVYIAKD